MAEPRELTQVDATSLVWRDILWILRLFQVKDKDLTAPPGTPTEGDRYIIASGATGTWATHDNQLVEWHAITGAAAAWHYVKPFKGFETWVEDENVRYRWNGTAWVALPGTSPSAAVLPYHEAHLITAGDVSRGYIDLTVSTYTTGNNSLQVRANGVWLSIEEGDYTETSTVRVSFASGVLVEGKNAIFDWRK